MRLAGHGSEKHLLILFDSGVTNLYAYIASSSGSLRSYVLLCIRHVMFQYRVQLLRDANDFHPFTQPTGLVSNDDETAKYIYTVLISHHVI